MSRNSYRAHLIYKDLEVLRQGLLQLDELCTNGCYADADGLRLELEDAFRKVAQAVVLRCIEGL